MFFFIYQNGSYLKNTIVFKLWSSNILHWDLHFIGWTLIYTLLGLNLNGRRNVSNSKWHISERKKSKVYNKLLFFIIMPQIVLKLSVSPYYTKYLNNLRCKRKFNFVGSYQWFMRMPYIYVPPQSWVSGLLNSCFMKEVATN